MPLSKYVILEESQLGAKILAQLDLQAYPSFLLLRPDGTILAKETGQLDEAHLKDMVQIAVKLQEQHAAGKQKKKRKNK